MRTFQEMCDTLALLQGMDPAEIRERKRREVEQLAWVVRELRAEFDEQTLTWLEPLVTQQWLWTGGARNLTRP